MVENKEYIRNLSNFQMEVSEDEAAIEWSVEYDDEDERVPDLKDPRRHRVGYKRTVRISVDDDDGDDACDEVRAVNMDGDGNCLFRAIAHQLDGGTSTSSEEMHACVRDSIVEYMMRHEDVLRIDFCCYLGSLVTWEQALAYLRRDRVWNSVVVDVFVPPVAARCFGRVVRVLQREVPPQEYWPDGTSLSGDSSDEPILLFRSADHYYSVRRDT